MATFLALLNFTDQGIRSVKDTTKRAAAARELAKAAGIDAAGMSAGVVKLEAALKEMHAAADEYEAAKLARVLRLDTMIDVRKVVDDVEAICPADKWTLATYKELLFVDVGKFA